MQFEQLEDGAGVEEHGFGFDEDLAHFRIKVVEKVGFGRTFGHAHQSVYVLDCLEGFLQTEFFKCFIK